MKTHTTTVPQPAPPPEFPALFSANSSGALILVIGFDGPNCLAGVVVDAGGSSHPVGKYSDSWGRGMLTRCAPGTVVTLTQE